MEIFKKLICVFFFLLLFTPQVVWGEDSCQRPDNDPCEGKSLEDKKGCYEKQISICSQNKESLAAQITAANNNIALTNLKIFQTQKRIDDLTTEIASISARIDRLEGSLSTVINVLISRIIATYKTNNTGFLPLLFSSSGISDFLVKAKYIKVVQEHDKRLLFQMQETKNNYVEQKEEREIKKKEQADLKLTLNTQYASLNQQKKTKEELLSVTKNSQANWEKMLAEVRAQIAALSSFSRTRAGDTGGTIAHADISDSWGKYYNQRDINWGNNYIGLSNELVWQVGCLLTAYAMVSSHYGSNIDPGGVAGNSDNFWLTTAMFRLPGPNPAGHSVEYRDNPSLESLKSEITAGNTIIAGLSADGGPFPQHYSDHWVVLRSVNDDGSFMINDPWYQNAMNVPLNDNYSGWSIIEARIYR